jgi:hypothetical protein
MVSQFASGDAHQFDNGNLHENHFATVAKSLLLFGMESSFSELEKLANL